MLKRTARVNAMENKLKLTVEAAGAPLAALLVAAAGAVPLAGPASVSCS